MSFSANKVRILNACFAGMAPRLIQCEMADRLTSHWRATALLPPTFFIKPFKSDICLPHLTCHKKFTKCNKEWQSNINQGRRICSYLKEGHSTHKCVLGGKCRRISNINHVRRICSCLKEGHSTFLIDAFDICYLDEPLPSACLDSRQYLEGIPIPWFTGPPRRFFELDNMLYSWSYVFWVARMFKNIGKFDLRLFCRTRQVKVNRWKEQGQPALLSRHLALLGGSRLKQRVKVIKYNENASSLQFSPP